MHRHGYKGRKLGRRRDERRNLIKGLASSLVIEESVTTTLPKAKEVVPYTEKLITKAKRGTLNDKRIVISRLSSKDAAFKLFDEVAPKLGGRNSGYFRISKTGLRRGDGSQMATISFVDDLQAPAKPAAQSKSSATKKAPAKSTAASKKSNTKKQSTKKTASSKNSTPKKTTSKEKK